MVYFQFNSLLINNFNPPYPLLLISTHFNKEKKNPHFNLLQRNSLLLIVTNFTHLLTHVSQQKEQTLGHDPSMGPTHHRLEKNKEIILI